MSADDSQNGQGRKTLLPELLPTLPAPTAGDALPPPARVAERARLLLQKFRGLGTTAGAAVLSLQCSGYGVVDPLPPPPMACNARPNPFADFNRTAWLEVGAAAPTIRLNLWSVDTTGLAISSVRVTGATILSMTDMTQSKGYFFVEVVMAADVPSVEILIEVDLACEGATRTRYYRIASPIPTGGGNQVIITDLPGGPPDGGTDAAGP
jgi:hypothetical protein